MHRTQLPANTSSGNYILHPCLQTSLLPLKSQWLTKDPRDVLECQAKGDGETPSSDSTCSLAPKGLWGLEMPNIRMSFAKHKTTFGPLKKRVYQLRFNMGLATRADQPTFPECNHVPSSTTKHPHVVFFIFFGAPRCGFLKYRRFFAKPSSASWATAGSWADPWWCAPSGAACSHGAPHLKGSSAGRQPQGCPSWEA